MINGSSHRFLDSQINSSCFILIAINSHPSSTVLNGLSRISKRDLLLDLLLVRERDERSQARSPLKITRSVLQLFF